MSRLRGRRTTRPRTRSRLSVSIGLSGGRPYCPAAFGPAEARVRLLFVGGRALGVRLLDVAELLEVDLLDVELVVLDRLERVHVLVLGFLSHRAPPRAGGSRLAVTPARGARITLARAAVELRLWRDRNGRLVRRRFARALESRGRVGLALVERLVGEERLGEGRQALTVLAQETE